MPPKRLAGSSVGLAWAATAAQVSALFGRGGFPGDPMYWVFGLLVAAWLVAFVAALRLPGKQARWAVLGSAPLLLLNAWLGMLAWSCARGSCF